VVLQVDHPADPLEAGANSEAHKARPTALSEAADEDQVRAVELADVVRAVRVEADLPAADRVEAEVEANTRTSNLRSSLMASHLPPPACVSRATRHIASPPVA